MNFFFFQCGKFSAEPFHASKSDAEIIARSEPILRNLGPPLQHITLQHGSLTLVLNRSRILVYCTRILNVVFILDSSLSEHDTSLSIWLGLWENYIALFFHSLFNYIYKFISISNCYCKFGKKTDKNILHCIVQCCSLLHLWLFPRLSPWHVNALVLTHRSAVAIDYRTNCCPLIIPVIHAEHAVSKCIRNGRGLAREGLLWEEVCIWVLRDPWVRFHFWE